MKCSLSANFPISRRENRTIILECSGWYWDGCIGRAETFTCSPSCPGARPWLCCHPDSWQNRWIRKGKAHAGEDWLLQPHVRERMLKGPFNKSNSFGFFKKTFTCEGSDKEPSAISLPSPFWGGSRGNPAVILPVLMWTELNAQENRWANVGAHKCKPQFKNVSLIAWRGKKTTPGKWRMHYLHNIAGDTRGKFSIKYLYTGPIY